MQSGSHDMRKCRVIKYLFIVFIVCGYTYVHAETAEQKHSIFAGAGYWLSIGAKDDLKNTIGFSAFYQYKFNKNLSATGGIYYFAPSIKGTALPSGSIKLIPVIANAQYTYNHESFSPYVSGGLAVFIVNYALSSDIIKAYDALGFDIDSKGKSKAGFNIGGGTLFEMNKKYSIFAEVRFFICSTTLENSITDRLTSTSHTSSNDISLNSLTFSGGIKFNLQ